MKLTKVKAKELCLKKWGYLKDTGAENGSSPIKQYPELVNLSNYCGYCELYLSAGCGGCPLYKMWDKRCNCKNYDDPYSKWCEAKTKKTLIKYATIMYNDIERS